MNIHVVRSDGSWYSRPDATLVRDADRFCLPDDCISALACRGRCIRIGKSGKAIAPAFARRYPDGWTSSVLFYGITADGTLTPLLDRATQVDREFRTFDSLEASGQEAALRALVLISRHLSLRIGDFIIIEREEPVPLQRGGTFENIDIL